MGKQERERIERIHLGEVPFKQKVAASNFIYAVRQQRIVMGDRDFAKMLNLMVQQVVIDKYGC